MKRLLLVILALFIGSPVCWCCVSHCATPVLDEDACPMCAESDSTPQREECPCSHGCAARELTQPDVALPAISENGVPCFVAVPEELGFRMSAGFERMAAIVFGGTGPPPPGRALYQLHCALLN